MSGVARQKPRSVSKGYSVTVKLCDSYCGFRLTSVDTPFRGGSARSMSIRLVMITPRSGVSVDGDDVDGVGEGWWCQHECPVC